MMVLNGNGSFNVASDLSENFITHGLDNIIYSKLFKYQSSGTMCDVYFSGGNGSSSVPAHSCVVAVMSPFLMRYILSHKKLCRAPEETCLSVLDIPISVVTKMVNESGDNCMDCMSTVIRYIYTGRINISKDHFRHIANISCNLEIDELISICRSYNVKVDSVSGNGEIHNAKLNCENAVLKHPEFTESKTSNPSAGRQFENEELPISSDQNASDPSDSKDQPDDTFVPNEDKDDPDASTYVKPSSPSISQMTPDTACLSLDSTEQQIGNKESKYVQTVRDRKSISLLSYRKHKQNIAGEKSLLNCKNNNLQRSSRPKDKKDNNCYKSNSSSNTSQDKQLNCLDCRKSFENFVDFDQHKLVFHSSKFNCLYCKHRTHILPDIIRHLFESKHGNKCSICFEEFQDNETFSYHLRNSHQPPLPFPCAVCFLKFKTRYFWKKHLVSHYLDRLSLNCQICGDSTFSSENELKIHIMKRHGKMKKTCDQCDYSTRYSSYLKRHMLKHERKVMYCEFTGCHFQTVWKLNLKNHMKSHYRTDKKFECTECSTTFSLKKNLQRHMRVHLNPTVYKCPSCDYSNIRFDKVKAHCRTHTNSHDIVNSLNQLYISSDCRLDNTSANNTRQELKNVATKTSVKSVEIAACRNTGLNEMSKDCLKVDYNSCSDKSQVVYLNETTGELTFFCDIDGQPLKGVPNIITVHSIGGVNTKRHFSADNRDTSNSTSVILNEITGELTYIELNFEPTSEQTCLANKLYSLPEVAVTVLDETTGEITSQSEQINLENDNNLLDFDSVFDTIDFDAMNDDSIDGFDDFDNALFDAEFSVGSVSPDMDKILNEVTGELFTYESTCRYPPLTKEIGSKQMHSLWNGVGKIETSQVNETDSQVNELAEIFLNEVTGELTAELSSFINH